MAESNFNKRINRYTANRLNGALDGVEEVVNYFNLKAHLGQAYIQIHGKLG